MRVGDVIRVTVGLRLIDAVVEKLNDFFAPLRVVVDLRRVGAVDMRLDQTHPPRARVAAVAFCVLHDQSSLLRSPADNEPWWREAAALSSLVVIPDIKPVLV